MPVRIPAAQAREIVTFGVAGLGGIAPVYFMLSPGADERMARQTERWAPRWEHVATNYLTPSLQLAVRNHITPPVERTMKHVDRVAFPHMERAALSVERQLKPTVVAGAQLLSGNNKK